MHTHTYTNSTSLLSHTYTFLLSSTAPSITNEDTWPAASIGRHHAYFSEGIIPWINESQVSLTQASQSRDRGTRNKAIPLVVCVLSFDLAALCSPDGRHKRLLPAFVKPLSTSVMDKAYAGQRFVLFVRLFLKGVSLSSRAGRRVQMSIRLCMSELNWSITPTATNRAGFAAGVKNVKAVRPSEHHLLHHLWVRSAVRV